MTLSEEFLRQFLDLNNKDFWDFSEEDWLDLELLWVKMDAYIAQNNLWERDAISLAQELLGEDPNGGIEVTKDDLWQLYDFIFGEGWAVMDNQNKTNILNTFISLPYEVQSNSSSIIDYLMGELELNAYPEVSWSKEGLNHLLYLYPLPGDQMTSQDWIDWDLLWGKYNLYADQNGFTVLETDPEQVLYDLLGEDPWPVDPVDPIDPVDPDDQDDIEDPVDPDEPVDPIEIGPSQEELYELIELHEKINGVDSLGTTDEEWGRFFTLYTILENYLYYDLEEWDIDPIDYAYESVGGTNPIGAEPSREELMIFEELYYKDWSEISEEKKSEYQRIY